MKQKDLLKQVNKFIKFSDKSAYLEPLKAEITAKIKKELEEYKIKTKV
jgi:hypothetical protein